MNPLHLPYDFALQSDPAARVRLVLAYRHDGGVSAMVESDRYPQAARVLVGGLTPRRHYLLGGAMHRFAHADAEGFTLIAMQVDAPTLITILSVV